MAGLGAIVMCVLAALVYHQFYPSTPVDFRELFTLIFAIFAAVLALFALLTTQRQEIAGLYTLLEARKQTFLLQQQYGVPLPSDDQLMPPEFVARTPYTGSLGYYVMLFWWKRP